MKKIQLSKIALSIYFSVHFFVNFNLAFAQNDGNQNYDFFATMSVRVYCTFAVFLPGADADKQNCKTDLVLYGADEKVFSNPAPSYATTTVTTERIIYEKPIKNETNIVYIPGPKGDKGDKGEFSTVSQNGLTLSSNFLIPQLTSGAQFSGFGGSLGVAGATGATGTVGTVGATGTSVVNILSNIPNVFTFYFSDGASSTVSLLFATSTNLANATITNATIGNSTSTTIFTNILTSLNGGIDNIIAQNATFTNSIFSNISSTNSTLTNATITNLIASNLFLTGPDATVQLETKDWASLGDSNLKPNYFATGNYNKNFFSSGDGNQNHFGNGDGVDNYFGEGLNSHNYFGLDSSSNNVFAGNTEFTGVINFGGSGTDNVYIGNIANTTNIGSGIINIGTGDSSVVNVGNSVSKSEMVVNASSTFTKHFAVNCVQSIDGASLFGTCPSDISLKENIQDIATSTLLNKISKLRFVTYSWNDIANKLYGKNKDTIVTGVLAQNIEEQFSNLVTVNKEGYKQVNFSSLQWYLFAAIKELNNKVDYTNNKVITFVDVVVNKITAKIVQTDKLCIKETCIDEKDLQDFLKYKQESESVPSTSFSKEGGSAIPISNTPVVTSTEILPIKATFTAATDKPIATDLQIASTTEPVATSTTQ